jgi:hypothetical protein
VLSECGWRDLMSGEIGEHWSRKESNVSFLLIPALTRSHSAFLKIQTIRFKARHGLTPAF